METQFSVNWSFFLSSIFVVSWFTHMAKFSIGKIFLIIASLLWLSKFLKIAIGIDFYLFPNSCHSKTTGLNCSIKNSIQFFENMARFSSEKGRRIFWSSHLYPLIWKFPRMQSIFKQFIFESIGSRSRKLQAWFHQSTCQTKVLNLQWQIWMKNLLFSPWLETFDNHRFPKSYGDIDILPSSNSSHLKLQASFPCKGLGWEVHVLICWFDCKIVSIDALIKI